MNAETVSMISQLIGSLGFPIVSCGVMYFMYFKTIKALQDSVEDLKDTVHQLIDRIEITTRKD